jgi:signal transduction histidine kinase
MSACEKHGVASVDRLNEVAYAFRYRNLDSTEYYAQQALQLSDSCGEDGAEAINHLAFVCLAKMQYKQAARLLAEVRSRTNNQVELLIADIQMMRLCQRQSKNKDFYNYRESAERRLRRILDEADYLSTHQKKRLVYAQSEMSIVASAYFYYVGLTQESVEAIEEIDPNGNIQQDMSQQLSYWYNIGSGGVLVNGTPEEIAQDEFEYLMRCYLMSLEYDYPYWEAQALQGMSEHLQKPALRDMLIRNNLPAMKYINIDQMPDSLLAGNLAQRSYDILKAYGDVYQIAGANRTLAECFWQIGDYQSALACLQRALNSNKAINQAPDLVASIREQLSLVYSAVDDKVNSDRNRNIYLDMQEQTRQDRQLEARAGQLMQSSKQLNVMLAAVIIMIVLVTVLLFVFDFLRRKNDARFSLNTLLEPLNQWRKKNEELTAKHEEEYDDIQEQTDIVKLHLKQNKRKNIEQRAKIQLVSHVMPLIDRMKNEVKRLQASNVPEEIKQQRYQYIAELSDTINDYNNVLTQWIQMRQGEVGLKIESFPLQLLFDIVSRGSMNYKMRGINLEVEPTTSVVKADRTLTLFMINTIADNARKFTSKGGTVQIDAHEGDDYVEISVKDNGCGMSEEQLSHVFDRTYTGGHGFGLKNCNGIIEKYKKISRIFKVCTIQGESVVGKGTRIFFRLPKGAMRIILMVLMAVAGGTSLPGQAAQLAGTSASVAQTPTTQTNGMGLRRDTASLASHYADSAYFSNINGTYHETLRYADSCHQYLTPADTAILLDISNETAVAALALHKWDLYEKNNKIYTQLFRKASADKSLPEYVRTMQKSGTNKNVAIILLVLLLAIIFPAYYFLYYRYRLDYKFCIDRINSMNKLLLGHQSDEEKLRGIDALNDFHKFNITSEEQEKLQAIVHQIRTALQSSINMVSERETSTELAGDNLRRLQMDNYQLHVSNSVLDNCLSALKHETMYYPSRIRQLVNETTPNLDDIDELVSYYRDLYRILSLQAVRQIPLLRLEPEQANYLLEILKTINKGVYPHVEILEAKEKYAKIKVVMTQYVISADECDKLFTPYTMDLNFLVCRQITREMGETTNLRACGMIADRTSQGQVCITITMPERCVTKEIRNMQTSEIQENKI